MPLPKLKMILTAVGCPGAVTMIRALKNNGERAVEIVGTDMRPEAAGRFFIDRFYTVPSGRSPDFVPRMLDIVEREQPDLVLPQSSYEVGQLAEHRDAFKACGAVVLVTSPESVRCASDKMLTYEALDGTEVPHPRSIRCTSLDSFLAAVHELGYPEKRVCFKPPDSKGARGFRVITDHVSRLDLLLRERSGSVLMTLHQATDVLGEAARFPDLMVMEFTEGKEHTVDVFCRDGQVLTGFVKTREAIKAGLAMYFETVDRPDLWEYGETVSERLKLEYFANIQFKGDQLLEVNPRVSTFVHQENFNMPYLGLKYVLGEIEESELQAASERVRSTRRTVRYYDQVFYDAQDLQGAL